MTKSIFTRLKIANKLNAMLLFLFLGSQAILAQNNTLSIDTLILPPTGILNDTGTAFIRVKNLDLNVPYSGKLYLHYSIDSSTSLPFLIDSGNTVTIQPLGTVNVSTLLTYSFPTFNTGSNIVVVWSSGNGRLAADTASDTVNIVPAGIYENDVQGAFSIFPSPAKNFINIDVSTLPKGVEQVIITDIFGRTVHAEPFRNSENQTIFIQHLSPGLYFLELKYADRRRAVQKFVRSE